MPSNTSLGGRLKGARPPSDSPVLFIGGWGRSGSTLLECLLAEMQDVTVLGEVVHLWERGLRLNERCACGEQFHSCSFWLEVGERAFAGWHNVNPDRVAELKSAVDRQRHVLSISRQRLPSRSAPAVLEYASYYRRVYDAARQTSGSKIIVDSSKQVPTALILSHDPAVDLRVLHIVRDSRGVAYSWAKTVVRPESLTGDAMTRYSVSKSTMFWISGNLMVQWLPRRGVPMTRVRYEDLVASPKQTVTQVWTDLGLPGNPTLPMSGPREVVLSGTHSVAGNPMRFQRGPIMLRPDVEWRGKMRTRDRILVTAMTYPALKWLGYRARPAEPAVSKGPAS